MQKQVPSKPPPWTSLKSLKVHRKLRDPLFFSERQGGSKGPIILFALYYHQLPLPKSLACPDRSSAWTTPLIPLHQSKCSGASVERSQHPEKTDVRSRSLGCTSGFSNTAPRGRPGWCPALTWFRSRSVFARERKTSGSSARVEGCCALSGLRKVKSLPSEAGEKHVL